MKQPDYLIPFVLKSSANETNLITWLQPDYFYELWKYKWFSITNTAT